MNSRNAQSQRQREHSGRPLRQHHGLLVTSLTLVGLLFGGCGISASDMASRNGTRCPDAVERLIDPQIRTNLEISLVVDGSGSFMGDRTAPRAFVAEQVALTVADAVDKRAALRVIVFSGSAGNARSVLECPTMAVRYRNEAARAAKVTHLKEVARDAVWSAVLNGRPPMTRPGTSVVGGFVALAYAAPLISGRREALMLSDGIALPEMAVAIDLSNFSSIGMYGVGQTEPPPSTREVDRLARNWRAWLALHGARQVVVSTQGYSSKVGTVP